MAASCYVIVARVPCEPTSEEERLKASEEQFQLGTTKVIIIFLAQDKHLKFISAPLASADDQSD